MESIPIDNTGCWVEYTFPNDFVLPADPLKAYQGSGMMAAANMPAGQTYATLTPGTQVYYANQGSVTSSGAPRPAGKRNVIVIEGCRTATGQKKVATVKFSGIETPAAAKTTKSFTVRVFHTYSAAQSQGSAQILAAEGTIPANYFTAGRMIKGQFIAPATLVQADTLHTISFTLTNTLPVSSSNAEYNSRIIIMMPEIMYVADQAGKIDV